MRSKVEFTRFWERCNRRESYLSEDSSQRRGDDPDRGRPAIDTIDEA